MAYKRSPSERNLQILRAARSKVPQTARRCANEYRTQLSQDIETAAITGKSGECIMAQGPTQSKTAPSNPLVREIISDKADGEMGRTLFWPLFQREHRISRRPRGYRMPAHHGWVRLRAVGRRTQQGHRYSILAPCMGPGNDGIPPDLIWLDQTL